MIKIDKLSKQFGPFVAVDNLSFTVQEGEVLGFLGPNGAGKSTTMKMITGFLSPTKGKVTVCDYDIAQDALAAKRLIGYLPEGAPCYGDMTCASFLNFIAEIRGFQKVERKQRIQQVVEQLELQQVYHKSIDTLSKGFKRRVGLAQAIIHDPKVLILDEPTDGLDPNQKYQVRDLIKNLSQDKIVIISTHILEEVSAVCTRAMIIAHGKLLADGTPDELAAKSPHHKAVTLRIEKGEGALEALSELSQVSEVKEIDGGRALLVIPKPNQQVYSAVSELVQQRAWTVDELFVQKGHLDEVFRQITVGSVAP
ncbi:MAG: ATP-binding cassette domain-containing protein [Pseudomonadales bacterium]|nr:ATP-binding cassette domain-containing protein [Pseudomonadales bacterium]